MKRQCECGISYSDGDWCSVSGLEDDVTITSVWLTVLEGSKVWPTLTLPEDFWVPKEQAMLGHWIKGQGWTLDDSVSGYRLLTVRQEIVSAHVVLRSDACKDTWLETVVHYAFEGKPVRIAEMEHLDSDCHLALIGGAL